MSKSINFQGLLVIVSLGLYCSYALTCNRDNKCVYRISRPDEEEYLLIKNILGRLYARHWDVTASYLSFYFDPRLKECDRAFDFNAIKQVIHNDFRHPNSLFEKVPVNLVNQTVKLQYEIVWLHRYKMISYELQQAKYVDQCNAIGLKLYYLLHEFARHRRQIFKCSTGHEETVSNLVDYYIAQTFIKSCDGNLEMIAHGIHKLLKYDCSQAYRFKIAYFNSKYLNLFRACDATLTVNDLLNSGRFSNCSAITAKKVDCAWYEIVCKFPEHCLRSNNWIAD